MTSPRNKYSITLEQRETALALISQIEEALALLARRQETAEQAIQRLARRIRAYEDLEDLAFLRDLLTAGLQEQRTMEEQVQQLVMLLHLMEVQ